MIKNIIKILLMITGNVILVCCITGQVDGIGRAAMILSGALFNMAGGFMSFKGKCKNKSAEE